MRLSLCFVITAMISLTRVPPIAMECSSIAWPILQNQDLLHICIWLANALNSTLLISFCNLNLFLSILGWHFFSCSHNIFRSTIYAFPFNKPYCYDGDMAEIYVNRRTLSVSSSNSEKRIKKTGD